MYQNFIAKAQKGKKWGYKSMNWELCENLVCAKILLYSGIFWRNQEREVKRKMSIA